MMKLWENDSFIDDNTLAVNINRLRKKLAEIKCNFLYCHEKRIWIWTLEGRA